MLGNGILSGYKTYILGGIAIVGAVASYLVGDLNLAAAAQLVVNAVLAMTVRAGIATAAATPK